MKVSNIICKYQHIICKYQNNLYMSVVKKGVKDN